MDKLTIPSTTLTPAIDFDYAQHRLSIRGESYPENILSFYGPVLSSLEKYLVAAVQSHAAIGVDIALTYINSASMRSLQQLLTMLDHAARDGAQVAVSWFVDPEDDMLAELGADLLEDRQWLKCTVVSQ